MPWPSLGHALYGSPQEDGGHHRRLQRPGPGGGQSLGGAGMAGRKMNGHPATTWRKRVGKIPWKIHEHVWKIHEKPWKTRKILWKTMKNEVLKWSGCYFTVKISWNHVKLAVLCGLCIRNQASIKMFEFSSGNLRDVGEVSLLRTCVYRFDKILLMRIIHGDK